ncbi:tRNA (adenosine(37)-N6)-threonylcarbamoyltransferase complex dimerization subunit type 1 TsaB [Candidatus Methylacidithermus pantelleriae]|uniref:Putative Inactive homolog of metal-dependent proteases, molecular chaperone n=1 Tax=Candidatus Methylacidithermus pantelleriae TaxID=2744239 RepID=A0A8J2FQ57_9BACT|nr:tRNA (adenosine(37)-N6)-threonylcarbamoyltransferase complex dimerization subunit type 1 TsaB [Candidatus Methylacidithermus pantelleriae]CAF0698023.1 putative Inactive homolog of metal-dependent proteases, molecular chaperone [Candidatus Methylacidithermus pantelleriae]
MMLALDCSFSPVSVALGTQGQIVWYRELPGNHRPTGALFQMLEEAIPTPHGISLILVGLGPGSFSGIRLAIAVAQGLALALGAKALGLYSVWSLGWRWRKKDRIGIFSDARRGELYATFFRQGKLEKGPMVISRRDLALWTQGLDRAISPDRVAPELSWDYPRASDFLELWEELGDDCLCPNLEPVYLRSPVP